MLAGSGRNEKQCALEGRDYAGFHSNENDRDNSQVRTPSMKVGLISEIPGCV